MKHRHSISYTNERTVDVQHQEQQNNNEHCTAQNNDDKLLLMPCDWCSQSFPFAIVSIETERMCRKAAITTRSVHDLNDAIVFHDQTR